MVRHGTDAGADSTPSAGRHLYLCIKESA